MPSYAYAGIFRIMCVLMVSGQPVGELRSCGSSVARMFRFGTGAKQPRKARPRWVGLGGGELRENDPSVGLTEKQCAYKSLARMARMSRMSQNFAFCLLSGARSGRRHFPVSVEEAKTATLKGRMRAKLSEIVVSEGDSRATRHFRANRAAVAQIGRNSRLARGFQSVAHHAGRACALSG